jgi:hypothetical protein
MNINFTTKHTSCSDIANGSILINTIELTPKEIRKYGKYIVKWSDNISDNQIHSGNFFADSLKPDTYSCRIVGNGHASEWHSVDIQNISNINISNLIVINDPCNKIASISFNVDGGKPPYTIKYGNQYLINQTDKVSIHDIVSSINNKLYITDANGCVFEYGDLIDIDFSRLSYRITDIEPPIVHDDHPQKLNIAIYNGDPPFRFDIYNTTDGNKNELLATTVFNDNTNIYSLANLVYPGDYIVDITDGHNCVYTTETIHIPNSIPLSAKITYKNTDPPPTPIICHTEFIFDTLLIPFNLLINDLSLRDWAQNLVTKSEISLLIGQQKYIQKIIQHNKHYRDYCNGVLDILHLGLSITEWYFSINIARGFNLQTDNVFSDLIRITVGETEYTVVPEIDNDISTIKLIRGNLLTNTTNVYDFKNSDRINIYDNSDYDSFLSCSYQHPSYLHNTYQPGNIFAINLLDNTYCNSLIDLKHPEDFVLGPDKINEINNLKQIVSLISDPSKDIDIAAVSSTQHNGIFSVLVTGSKNNNSLTTYKYNKIDNTLCPINTEIEIINAINLQSLNEGTYIVKVKTCCRNKLKYINNQSYDNHYTASVLYIKNQLGCSLEDLNFEYGDILINIAQNNNESPIENLPGIDNTEIQTYKFMSKNQIDTLSSPIKKVSENESYSNTLKISCPSNVVCEITGPNNFSHICQGNISLINMLPGVYTIKGENSILPEERNKIITHKIYIGHNSKEYISIS